MTIQSLSRNKKNALSAIDEYLRRGSEARSSGAFSAAFACYVQALKLDSRKYQGWVGLALCCGDMGRPALSEKAALRAIEIEPSIPHAWQILAEFRLKAGDAAGVLALAGKAAELNPGSHIPDYIKAKILRSENNGRGAEKCCRLALAKEPGFMPAWHELLGLAASSGAFGRMVGVAGEAIRNCAKTDCPGLISALGSALFADPPSGPRLDAAAKIYGELGGTLRERGLRLPENFSREMAVCQVRGGRLREAEAGLAGFLGTMRPDSGSSVESFRAKFCLGRYREAFEEGEKLLKRKEISLVDLRSPWFSNRIAPPSFWKKHISLLSGTEVPAGLLIWKSFYLSALRSLVLRTGADFSGISKGFSGRYGWMNFYPACETLGRCDFPGALAKFRRVAAC
ncbi:MAG: hypothetical protein Q8O90_09815, partial [Elusimicrobiota bacterium]|nr:hypothetical protein [Elusimicrobiota bacterium]